MRIQKVTFSSRDIRRMYLEAFPPKERMPFSIAGGYKNGFLDTGYRMKLSGVEQEILISNGDFDKNEFRLFFVLYSNGTVWPKIWRNEKEKNIQEHLERMGI